MKKLYLLVLAFVAATAAFAQENLAKGATVTGPAYGVTDQNPDGKTDWGNIVDDNDGTMCQASKGNNVNEIVLKLSDEKTFNVIQIHWQNVWATNFKIYGGEDDNSESDGIKWTEAQEFEYATGTNGATFCYELNTALTTKYVKLVSSAMNMTTYGIAIYELRLFNMQDVKIVETATLAGSTGLAKIGTEVTLDFKVLDQIGREVNIEKDKTEWTVSPSTAGTVYDGKYIPAAFGPATIIAENNGVKSNEISVFAHEGDNLVSANSVIETSNGVSEDKAVAFDGNEQGGEWILHSKTDGDETSRTYDVHFVLDLLAEYEVNLVNLAFDGASSAAYTLLFSSDKENWTTAKTVTHPDGITQWVDRLYEWDNNAAESGVRYIKFLSTKATSEYGIKLKEVSVYAGTQNLPIVMDITPDTNGFWKVKGKVNSTEKLSDLNELLKADESKVAYDLSEVVFDITDDVTLTPANPNAIIIVPGSCDHKNTKKFSGVPTVLEKNKNIVVKTDGYYFPLSQIELTDGYPVYTKSYIASNTTGVGYKYTRKISGGKFVTTYLPSGITLPEGLTAYALDNTAENQKSNEIHFTKKEGNSIDGNTPYIIYADRDVDFVLVSANGELNMSLKPTSTELASGLSICGTYDEIIGSENDNYYGFYNNINVESVVLKKVQGGKIGAFRAYFIYEGDESEAKDIRFVFSDGSTTGISSVAAEAVKQANVYSIDGRFINATGSTENLAKGLYIVNGKKVIVK